MNSRYILTGEYPEPLKAWEEFNNQEILEVISGNIFDESAKIVMYGFGNDVMVNFVRMKNVITCEKFTQKLISSKK